MDPDLGWCTHVLLVGMPYCNHYGIIYSKKDNCLTKKVPDMASRSATVAAKLAALKESFRILPPHSLVEEKEKKTREAIQEVEAEIRLTDLEAKLQYLKEERDRVRLCPVPQLSIYV